MNKHDMKTQTAHGVKIMTKEEVQMKTDEELLQMVKKAQKHTNNFAQFMGCDFSYTYLINLLHERGYENGWHRATNKTVHEGKPEIIKLRKPEGATTRKSYIIEGDIANQWKEFNLNVPYPSVTIGSALQRFMSDYKEGRIKLELDI